MRLQISRARLHAAGGRLVVLVASWFVALAACAEQPTVHFSRDVRPILSENCFFCHGADEADRQADLRLDKLEEAIEYGYLMPGDPEGSELIRRIESTDLHERMPPPDSNRSLSDEQVATLRKWIAEGAHHTGHWAFESVSVSEPPPGDNRSKGAIDRFVDQRLLAEGIEGSPRAEPEQWLRRVSFDLNGLPPTIPEIDRFREDVSERGEAAYEAAVDRLLASPHYGERMAIDWLDVARYADTHGFNNDSARSMWRYRDWVIDSFNRNLPYDEFLTEQLAGDLLEDPTLDQRIATGFGRNHVINSEGGIIDEEYRVEYVADRVRTTSMAWLGLTFECARCHDHKYDPISQKDYYRLFAFFNNVPELGEDGRVANAPPMIPAPTADQRRMLASYDQAIEALRRAIEAGRGRAIQDEESLAALGLRAEEIESMALPAPQFAMESTGVGRPYGEPNGASFPRAEPVSFPAESLSLSPKSAHSIVLWVSPSAERERDVPLVSSMTYLSNPADQAYGKGVELRLVGEEVEYVISERLPAYSITVRTLGAKIEHDQWRHVAVTFAGDPSGEGPPRAQASGVSIWIDGEPIETEVRYDGLSYLSQNLIHEPYRIGVSTEAGAQPFRGQIYGVMGYAQELPDEALRDAFLRFALPAALTAQTEGAATQRQTRLLQDELLETAGGPGRDLVRKLRRVKRERIDLVASFPRVMVMSERDEARQAHVLTRGLYDQPGEPVTPGVPEELLGEWPDGAPRNRLGLAMWLTQPDHPLTSRVVVNRFWQQLFGVGLVKTSEDFGAQGEWPSHPELLDWLAQDFASSGWDVKRLFRQIVLSDAYRRDSATSADLLSKDPSNRLLARGPRVRLPAELIRDQALAVSGLLGRRIGGPSVRPYQPQGYYDGIVVGAAYPGTTWDDDSGEGLYRRSLYTFWKRTALHPAMLNFDAPDREFCSVRRYTTNTPLQALNLLNDVAYIEAARKLAERVLNESEEDRPRLEAMFRRVVSRAPTDRELARLADLLALMREDYQAENRDSEALIANGASPRAESIEPAELAAWTVVGSAILNLDEAIYH